MSSIVQEAPATRVPDPLSCSVPQPLGPSGLSAFYLQSTVRAGFPSPAEDFQAKRIDVLERLVKHPQATREELQKAVYFLKELVKATERALT